ncbi:poly-beta-hydroxybutyrate-responsive repressor [Desulfotomaculum arcticum]|uniref:Poly-beta-hydroxybutyrate-responsive repressor n=1 Tax=Desulfotruncus arcticus DSM 17038 TaxID=1121424 RepID=A0A1I2UYA0_9FIRM|nr:PadR family transcriptional regulator [Desulfotruncus arcticus]SFG81149.1 poly-beta-hydroxybutyrate-responsive repressor [Desulfotomaculum arcticum] [Desulfotruncus arcticus DSM 17038]
MTAEKTENGAGVALDRMIQPMLLLLILKKPTHGYELIQSFNALHEDEIVEPGTIYRNLRRMEKEGFVLSSWEASESGPARRKYDITEEGIKALQEAVLKLERQKQQIEDFLTEYNDLTARRSIDEN